MSGDVFPLLLDRLRQREVDGMTHAQIGRLLGISGARVRAIEAGAIEKMRVEFVDGRMLGETKTRGLR